MRTALGCLASTLYFAVLGLVVFSLMLPECFPGFGHACPTDHERNLRIVVAIVLGLAIYAAIGTAIERRWFRRD